MFAFGETLVKETLILSVKEKKKNIYEILVILILKSHVMKHGRLMLAP